MMSAVFGSYLIIQHLNSLKDVSLLFGLLQFNDKMTDSSDLCQEIAKK